MYLENIGRNHVWLQSLDPNQGPVELLGIDEVSTSSADSLVRSSSVRVAAVQIGITEDKQDKAREFKVIVRLQPSGILSLPTIQNKHFTGEILIQRIEAEAAVVQLGKSDFEAGMTYEYDEKEEYGNKITNRIQRATLIGKVRVETGESLFDKHEGLKDDLSDVCIALSLCYRQIVDYYEIEYIDCGDKPKPWETLHRRRWNSTKVKTAGDELINTRALVGAGLQRLFASIQTSPRSEDLRRAIKFIAASYTTNIETAFFMTFSAMETVVLCCLDKSELHRHLARRVQRASKKYCAKTDDLWLNMSFEEGMKRAAKIRNGLFHAADSSFEESISKDLIRVRTFAERLLLKLLSWPDDDIWNWCDQDLKWTNQGDG